MTRLRSCDGCSRHVFVTERVCPFCQRELTPPVAAPAVQVPSGMSRAQRFALAAALAGPGLGAASCSKTITPMDGAPVAARDSAGSGAPSAGPRAGAAGMQGTAGTFIAPPYGVPIAGNPMPVAGSQGLPVAGQFQPVYGAPVAGNPAPRMDAGTPPDDDAGVTVPPYGSPIPQE